jgi:hypothetical protein
MLAILGEVPERPKGADCKSAGVGLRRFESSPPHWCEEYLAEKLSRAAVGGFSPIITSLWGRE